eukprot:CAMPEP_0117653786 /NCGR_PEP_ID=MMETSP0804-20121206/3386_1 /TAXON_ID=1074897 /ORGANISM="Tetraselmis astigmatica, Strain CCMP880" /LENGTH=190 /DNA_ID=CAMNT_0005460003 /DNA_START=517 /DNA_END=1091 /DNA_ORIENTATION=-
MTSGAPVAFAAARLPVAPPQHGGLWAETAYMSLQGCDGLSWKVVEVHIVGLRITDDVAQLFLRQPWCQDRFVWVRPAGEQQRRLESERPGRKRAPQAVYPRLGQHVDEDLLPPLLPRMEDLPIRACERVFPLHRLSTVILTILQAQHPRQSLHGYFGMWWKRVAEVDHGRDVLTQVFLPVPSVQDHFVWP